MSELIRDCEHCKHYIEKGKAAKKKGLPPLKGCELWECEFEENSFLTEEDYWKETRNEYLN